MRVTRSTATRSPLAKRGPAGKASSPKVMFDLAIEFNQVINDFLVALGQSRVDLKHAAELAGRQGKRQQRSADVLQTARGLSELLHTWRKHSDYRNADGSPRVLPIRGKGLSLEKLARKYLPLLPLNEALSVIREQSEILPCEDNKVALSGSSMALTNTTPEATLAWMITQTRHLAGTILYNRNLPATDRRRSRGRPERRISAIVSEARFNEFLRWVRPKISKFGDDSESFLDSTRSAAGKGRGKRSGVIVFAFRED